MSALPQRPLPTREEFRQEWARRLQKQAIADSLKLFVQRAWAIVEPATEFVSGYHLDAIAEHLEACTRRQIRKLIINIPPRHMKSLSVCVFWPTWVWIKNPASRWLFASYAESLAMRDSVKCRDILTSDWYQQHWGSMFRLKGDQNAKTRFENDRTGFRMATGVGGGATGEGGDYLVIDDPHNIKEAESKTIRESVLNWYDTVWSRRGNDPKTVVKVVVMQRLHQKDLTGHLLEQGDWQHLRLPAEFDGKRIVTSIGWQDPRKAEGELLWPERFGKKEVAEAKRELGTYGWSGQGQQEPSPPGGSIFKRQHFRYFTCVDGWLHLVQPNGTTKSVHLTQCIVFQTVDTAQKTEQENDYTVVTTFVLTPDSDILIYDVARDKVEIPKQYGFVRANAGRCENVVFQAVEDKGSGTGLIQEAKNSGRPFKTLKADIDKVRRALPVSIQYENGKVYHLANAAWLVDFEGELLNFPKGEHDDQVDTVSYGGIIVQAGIATFFRKDDEPVASKEVENPHAQTFSEMIPDEGRNENDGRRQFFR